MIIKIFLDFETRSFVDLKKVGAWRYSQDPSTEILCMSWQREGEDKVFTWVPLKVQRNLIDYNNLNEIELTEILPLWYAKKNPDVHIVSRNALFEYAIMRNICIPRHNFSEYFWNPAIWECTQGMSYLAGIPGKLEKCAQALHLENQKSEVGKGLIQKFSKPIKKKGADPAFRPIALDDMTAMVNYNVQDVKTDSESYSILSRLPNVALERDLWELDFKLNIKGVPVDLTLVKTMLEKIQEKTVIAENRMNELGVNVRSGPQLKAFFAKYGIDLDNCQADTLENIETDNSELQEVLLLRFFLSRASIKKYQALLDRTDPDDSRLRYFLLYYGAHTGRYSSVGVQLHNLPNSRVDENTVEKAIQDIQSNPDISLTEFVRLAKIILPGCIQAEPGHVLLKGDFSAVEARGLAYLAGDEVLLNRFRNNEKIYEQLAGRVFNCPPGDIQKGSFQREVGKKGVLGGGYGIGAKKFKAMCAKEGVLVSDTLAEKTVWGYREEFPKIPRFWREIETAFILAWTGRKVKTSVKVGKHLTVTGENSYVKIQLPSGRFLYYHGVKIIEGKISYRSRETSAQVALWGGVLTENVTQAFCRDLLKECLLNSARRGLNPIFHVHDEIVLHEKEENLGAHKNIFEKVMNTAPEWAPDFPLKTEIFTCYRYYK